MLTLLFIVYLKLFSLMIAFAETHGYALLKNALLFCDGFGTGIFDSILAMNVAMLIELRDIDNLILKYTCANLKIETGLQDIVRRYINCSIESISDFSGKEIVDFANSFPKLRSLISVQSLSESWQDNQETLKQLKRAKAEISACKWRLYFGK